MKYSALTRASLFFLLILSLVFVFPSVVGAIGAYALMIMLSIMFVIFDGIKVKERSFILGSIVAVLSMTSAFILMLVSGSVEILSVNPEYAVVLFSAVILQGFVAFGEELSFRQYLFQVLGDTIGKPASAVITSIAFAALHIPSMIVLQINSGLMVIAFLTIFLASILLTLLYVYGGILNAVAFHFFWNLLQYNIFGLGPLDSVLKVSKSGEAVLNGGSFGAEASIIGLAVTVASIIVLSYYFKAKPSPENEIY
ncbi:CPBP family intramembrane metalloprotease [Methanocella sp. CWC-04]|uniref:CPBP family intramembrane metalloprotease n=1 Tax=Methanooceanicella nereidis TaxID=2052831 RepID=A0AAP2RCK8_9EURY|nr:CPBP family intramembrane glutamic endopeptidase [Methanocella sp. CWC-04]MCD1294396.1 CPBP family intramembrane metalloprotease [Methanocella sp. CWC-04]